MRIYQPRVSFAGQPPGLRPVVVLLPVPHCSSPNHCIPPLEIGPCQPGLLKRVPFEAGLFHVIHVTRKQFFPVDWCDHSSIMVSVTGTRFALVRSTFGEGKIHLSPDCASPPARFSTHLSRGSCPWNTNTCLRATEPG